MNIKRIVAADMRGALREIRETLGPDAVILSSRPSGDSVEVIAAVDFDERLFTASEPAPASTSAAAPQQPRPAPRAVPADGAPAASPASALSSPAPSSEYERIAASVRAADESPQRESITLATEIKDLRHLLETQLASLAWNDLGRRMPQRTRALRQLARLRIDPDLARDLASLRPPREDASDGWRLPLQALAERIPVARRELDDAGRIFAVVGPTGVGKTTSIAKIAARFVLRRRAQDLGIVSTDTYRVGAREQLLTFARILGVPLHVAENAGELRDVLDSLASKKFVLIDTAGMGQRDVRLAQQFATLKSAGHAIHPVLAVSAANGRDTLAETFAAFGAVGPKALIITKIDEATTLGPVLSLAIRGNLPIAYVADGQRVPEDIHLAGPKRSWLMRTAMALARERSTAPDEDDLAREFGTPELAAHG